MIIAIKIKEVHIIKRLLILTIILALILPGPVYGAPKASDNSDPEKFTVHFLQSKMNILISGNTEQLDKYYIQSECSEKYMLYTKIEILQDYLIPYFSNDYMIKKVVPHVKIISKDVSGDIAAVEASLETDIYWNASNALGKSIMGIKLEKHKFILKREKKQWKIYSDKYVTDRGNSDDFIDMNLSELINTFNKLKNEAADLQINSKNSEPTRLLLMKATDYNADFNSTSSNTAKSRPVSSAIYNRDAAYNWAYTYWNNYSPAYQNFGDSEFKGGDCTNFVSQCLRAGGAKNDKVGAYQWYYDSNGSADTSDDNYSWTWSTARGLNYILLGNYKNNEYGPKGIQKTISGDAQYTADIGRFLSIGDIIQYQWEADKKITHSAIIVGILYNSSKDRYEPVISTHSIDSWYTPWSRNAYKTYFVHIAGIN